MKRFATLLALHVVLSVPVSAQEVVRYRAPDGSIKTVSSAEHQSRIGELRTLIDDLDTNRKVVLTMTGSPVVVTNARLHEIRNVFVRADRGNVDRREHDDRRGESIVAPPRSIREPTQFFR